MQIRDEHPQDADAIRQVTEAAFATVSHSSGSEGRIIDALRAADALTLSLVAVRGGEVIGHIAFSPVRIDDRPGAWFGLGPVSVRPDLQGLGIGAALIREGLDRLRGLGGQGCVLLGDPRYYGRFGFVHDPALTYAGGPPHAFQRLVLEVVPPRGKVSYHAAFGID